MKIKIIDNNPKRQRIYYREAASKASKYKGVYYNTKLKKKKWIVKICYKMIYYYIGSFDLEDKAASAYDWAILKILEQDAIQKANQAQLNFPASSNHFPNFSKREAEKLIKRVDLILKSIRDKVSLEKLSKHKKKN